MSPSEPGLIIFDPLRNIHTEDENDSKAMTKVTDAVRKIRDTTGASIVVTHHLRKPTKGDVMVSYACLQITQTVFRIAG